jgi:hypothetical protein
VGQGRGVHGRQGIDALLAKMYTHAAGIIGACSASFICPLHRAVDYICSSQNNFFHLATRDLFTDQSVHRSACTIFCKKMDDK